MRMEPTADTYTHGHHDSVLRSHRWRTAGNSAAYLLPLLEPGMSILDVGCGPGNITADLADLVAPGPVVGIDVAASVLEEARALASERGAGNISFIPGDFRAAGLAPGSFDVVHAHQVLQHLRDPVDALRAMGRLAKPGGIVAARDSDYSAMTWAPDDDRLDRWRAIYLQVTRRNGAEANAGRWLLRWAHQAGLHQASYSTSTWTYATPADRTWWGDLWAERALASTFAEQAVAYGVATPGELADIADAWRTWSTHPDSTFMIPHGELLARRRPLDPDDDCPRLTELQPPVVHEGAHAVLPPRVQLGQELGLDLRPRILGRLGQVQPVLGVDVDQPGSAERHLEPR